MMSSRSTVSCVGIPEASAVTHYDFGAVLGHVVVQVWVVGQSHSLCASASGCRLLCLNLHCLVVIRIFDLHGKPFLQLKIRVCTYHKLAGVMRALILMQA